MKVLLLAVLAIVAAATAERMSYSLNALDWSTPSVVLEVFPAATKKDLLAYIAISSNGGVVSLRRRNSEGEYELVGNFSQPTSPLLGTNGKWVAMFADTTVLFSIDENNQVSSPSQIPVPAAHLLSDDTVVGFDPVSQLADGNYSIRTYDYDAVNNIWNEIPGTEVIIPFGVSFQLGITSFHAIDTHLVLLDPIAKSVRIYERQVDLSWDLVETVPVNGSQSSFYGLRYNGVDTLVLSSVIQDGEYIGVVFIYTKINGEWVEQTLTGGGLGYRPALYLGLVVAFVDENNLLLSAGFDGYDGTTDPSQISFGKVLYVTRGSNGLWEPAVDLIGADIFGLGVGVNDYDIVVPSVRLAGDPILTFYTAPRCFAEPIDVTCNNQQVNDCSEVQVDELYTINNPQCGAVSVSVNGLSLVNNQEVSMQLTFTRGYGADFSCIATTTCPAPPVAPVAPIAQIPVGSPAKVSSSNVLRIGVASIFLYAFAMLV